MTIRAFIRSAATFCVAGALLALCAGCGSKVIGLPKEPEPERAPEPASSMAVVERLMWSWTHLDPAPCVDLITSDYVYTCPVPGSTEIRWFRDTELAIARRLFVEGTSQEPAAEHISFVLYPGVSEGPDPRPGKDPLTHRVVTARIEVGIRLPEGDFRIQNVASFYAVRGDVARIPQELRDAGMLPDSTRWWLERWEDAPIPATSGSQGGRLLLLGQVKALYLDPAVDLGGR